MLLGGVTPEQVIQAWLVLVVTALAAGSLGGLIALWRDRTFQSLALSVLALVLYFVAVRALEFVPPSESINWPKLTAWLDPFAALQSVLGAAGRQCEHNQPGVGFRRVMFGWSVALNAWGIYKLRDWNPGGEPIMQREGADDDEAKSRESARRPGSCPPGLGESDPLAGDPHEGVRPSADRRQAGVRSRVEPDSLCRACALDRPAARCRSPPATGSCR